MPDMWGHKESINSIAFSPDSKFIVTGSSDKTVRIWDVARRKEMHVLRGHQAPVGPVAISPDGRIVVSASYNPLGAQGPDGRSVRLWDVNTGKELRRLERDKSVYTVTWSPDGRLIATAGGGNASEFLDP